MSLTGSRLQVAAGPTCNKGYGRQLPQGGFQSVDVQYTAEERCKIALPGQRLQKDNSIHEKDVIFKNNAIVEIPQLKQKGHLEIPTDFDKDE